MFDLNRKVLGDEKENHYFTEQVLFEGQIFTFNNWTLFDQLTFFWSVLGVFSVEALIFRWMSRKEISGDCQANIDERDERRKCRIRRENKRW